MKKNLIYETILKHYQINGQNLQYDVKGLGLWCLMPLSTTVKLSVLLMENTRVLIAQVVVNPTSIRS